MFYLIFKNGRFLGYSVNKDTIKLFIKERNSKDYKIQKIKESEMNELKNNPDFLKTELAFYELYNCTLFEYEFMKIQEIGTERFLEIHKFYLEIKKISQYLKFDNTDKKTIKKFFNLIELISDDLLHEESCVTIDEYFNIKDIVHEIVSCN